MELDPRNAYAAIQTGFDQLYALTVSYSLSFVGAVVLLIVGYMVANLVERTIAGGLKHIHGFDLTLARFLAAVGRYAVLMFVGVMVLGQFGVQTASIIAAIGAAGLAIGLALQGTLQNIAAGIMLLVLRPFRIGEDIEVGAISGLVEEIGLFATRLRTAEGVFLLAPNSTLWNQPVRNFTRNGMRRNDIVVTVADAGAVADAESTLLAVAGADARVRRKPAPTAFVSELGEDAIKVTLRYWTSASDFIAAKAELTKKVVDHFRKPAES
jgi:small conductance mechanosensitive channel